MDDHGELTPELRRLGWLFAVAACLLWGAIGWAVRRVAEGLRT